MQIPVNQRLGIIQKSIPKFSDFRLQNAVLVQHCTHHLFRTRRQTIPVPFIIKGLIIRLRQHKILRDVTKFRIGKEHHLFPFFLSLHH